MNPSIHPGVAEPRTPKIVGRPAFHATDEDRAKVARMSRLGIPQSQIAIVIGITLPTLRKHFRQELIQAIETHLKVATTLFQMATSGTNTAATIFWAKTRCGFGHRAPSPEEVLDED
jgi:hypothetical protein